MDDLPPDELFGWEVLLDKARPGPGATVRGPSKKHRHNELALRVGLIGAAATRQTLIKEHTMEMDAWKIADPIAQRDIHHSPDYVLVDGHTTPGMQRFWSHVLPHAQKLGEL